jgi:CubicO group peptidase (beta-lactamase class C family)
MVVDMTVRLPEGMTLTNWDLGGPISDWAYSHTREWMRTAELSTGLRGPTLVSAPRELPEFVRNEVESGRVAGFTALVDGAVAHRWPEHGAGDRLLMSVSKVAASLAIGILVERGLADYDAPIRSYLPQLDSQWDTCTLLNVLDMASGVNCPEVGDPGAYQNPNHPFFQFEASLDWRPRVRQATPYQLVSRYERTGMPGTTYNYTSANTFLLAWAIEALTGERYSHALQHLIWDRLALEHDASIAINRDGTAVAHGGLIMSTDDLARFGAVFTHSGRKIGHQLSVPPSYEEMLMRHRNLRPTRIPDGCHPAGHWNWVSSKGDRFKSGFGGQGLFVSPVNDVVIAFTGNPDESGRSNQLASFCQDWAATLY